MRKEMIKMNNRILITLSIIANIFFGGINGQLGTVGTPCYSSGTCFGYTTCQQNRCMCSAGYQQMGQSCIQMGMGGGYGMGMGSGYGMGMGYGMGGMGYGSYGGLGYGGMGYGGIGNIGGIGGMGGCQPGMSGCGGMIYPGQACGSSYGNCGFGSICQSGICCCQSGYSQTSTGCVPGVGMAGMGGLGMGMMGMGMGGYGGMMGGGYGYPGMGCGGNMGMGCGGGSFCQSGMCTCPQNYLYQNNMCMPMGGMGMGMGSYGGYGGGMGMGYGGGMGMGGLGMGQIVLSINVGGYCQQQSMMSHCTMGASCMQNTCRCMGDFYNQGMGCIRRRFRKDPKDHSNEQPPQIESDTKKPIENNSENPPQPASYEKINTTSSSNSIINWLTKL